MRVSNASVSCVCAWTGPRRCKADLMQHCLLIFGPFFIFFPSMAVFYQEGRQLQEKEKQGRMTLFFSTLVLIGNFTAVCCECNVAERKKRRKGKDRRAVLCCLVPWCNVPHGHRRRTVHATKEGGNSITSRMDDCQQLPPDLLSLSFSLSLSISSLLPLSPFPFSLLSNNNYKLLPQLTDHGNG